MSLNFDKIKLTVIDFDGVLADTGADIAAAIQATQEHYGIKPWDKSTILTYVGHGAKKLVDGTLKDAGEDKLADALKWYCGYYYDHTTVYTRLYPGVREFLEELKLRGVHACVLTNKPEAQTLKILKELDADKLFDIVIGPESVGKLKPDPEGIFYCMNKLGVKASETVMIGDSYSDIVTGRAAETYTCGVLYGIGNVEKLLGENPDVCVKEDLRELFGEKYTEEKR